MLKLSSFIDIFYMKNYCPNFFRNVFPNFYMKLFPYEIAFLRKHYFAHYFPKKIYLRKFTYLNLT